MFGKAIIGIAQNLTDRFNLAGGGYSSSNRLNTARFALLLVHTLLFLTLLPAQTQQMRVVIGHNRLAILNAVGFSYGHFSPPSSTEETTVRIHFDTLNCEPNRDSGSFCEFTIPAFPHHGIIMWINHDSGWQPSSWFWQQLRINGQETVRFRAPGDTEERDYRIYLLPYNPDNWQRLLCSDGWQSFLCFVFEPYGVSVWEQRAAEERKLIIYVDEYGYYWQLCRYNPPPTESSGQRCSTCCEVSVCWVQRDNWDGTPDFEGRFGSPHLCGWFQFFFYLPYGGWRYCWRWICEEGRPRAARLLFKGTVTSLPIISDIPQSADAAVDNRPVCPDPELPPTFAKFGTYTHLGGLFVGQVPWQYGERWQTAPDLSGTGRTLLKFYNPTGFPNRVEAACVSLAYTATPYWVAAAYPHHKPIGVVAVPRSDWDENSVSWAFLQEVGLGCPFSEYPPNEPAECRNRQVEWIGSTQWLHELVRPPVAENALDQNGNLKIRPERGNSEGNWERNWRQIKRVVIPLSQWTAQGNYLSLLLALHPEEPFSPELSPYVWYYFLAKEHELTDGRTCPRLWYVVKEQP